MEEDRRVGVSEGQLGVFKMELGEWIRTLPLRSIVVALSKTTQEENAVGETQGAGARG
jgi:hypothetical protein